MRHSKIIRALRRFLYGAIRGMPWLSDGDTGLGLGSGLGLVVARLVREREGWGLGLPLQGGGGGGEWFGLFAFHSRKTMGSRPFLQRWDTLMSKPCCDRAGAGNICGGKRD